MIFPKPESTFDIMLQLAHIPEKRALVEKGYASDRDGSAKGFNPRACAPVTLCGKDHRALPTPARNLGARDVDTRNCCRSSVVEHSLGKGEIVSSILTGSTRRAAKCLLAWLHGSLTSRYRQARARGTARCVIVGRCRGLTRASRNGCCPEQPSNSLAVVRIVPAEPFGAYGLAASTKEPQATWGSESYSRTWGLVLASGWGVGGWGAAGQPIAADLTKERAACNVNQLLTLMTTRLDVVDRAFWSVQPPQVNRRSCTTTAASACLAVKLAEGAAHHIDERRHGVRLREPGQRFGRRGARARVRGVMRRGEHTADAMPGEQFE